MDQSIFTRLVAQSGLVNASVLDKAIELASREGMNVSLQLGRGLGKEWPQLLAYISRSTDIPLVDVSALSIDALPKSGLKPDFLAAKCVLPIRHIGKRLWVAAADPTDVMTTKEIQFQTSCSVTMLLADAKLLAELLEKMSRPLEGLIKELGDQEYSVELESEENASSSTSAELEVDDAPVVRLINKLVVDGVMSGASDIHFEPYEKFYRVRYRLDGKLREVAHPPLVAKERIASRLKVISKLDISEKRIPQDGRTRINIGNAKVVDLRVSALPTQFGEKICLRILDPANLNIGLEKLGYDDAQRDALLDAIGRPYGMVLVTGPTGSGKTVSLYTCLGQLNAPDVNISTAEDPVEINVPGINQVSINERAGMTFAAALKSFLRQDPDVIMVGEIRDLETAEMAIKAAQTGHLVLSTLHTNDAPSTLTRLLNMGVPSFNLATSVSLITAQRLARRLCSCKVPRTLSFGVLRDAGGDLSDDVREYVCYEPKGCEICEGSGYKGRVGIYQVMPISLAMQEIIMKGGNAIEIAKQSKADGVRTLRQAGILKVLNGETSLQEVVACTNID